MSLREEDRQNKNCPSRGLGLAAAAIGVGVGAALYYFFSKRTENPHEEGSTSTWECEPTQAFMSDATEQEDCNDCNDSYTTISEHSTTDTSINMTPLRTCHECLSSDEDSESYSDTSSDSESVHNDSYEASLLSQSNEFDSDWSVTDTSSDVPDASVQEGGLLSILYGIGSYISPRNLRNKRSKISEEEQIKFLRDQAFRERSWSLEECSICFEVILKNQEVMSLPCTHHFHTACILPWLQEQQTCPNCRKAAE